MGEKAYSLKLENLIALSIIIISLYIVSLKNYVLFHVLVELFSVLVGYIVFLIIWKSKGFISNRYLIFIGIAYFFTGSYDLLHTLAFKGMGVFPGLDSNPSVQFWLIARYLESTSFLIASLFLIQNKNNEMDGLILLKNSLFARRIFLVYALITIYLFLSVLYLKSFPTCYIEGSGNTPFKIISEYVISFVMLCSLVLLYVKGDRFETKVFKLIAIAIIFTFLGGAPFLIYSHMDKFPSVIGHFFKALSFYYLYLAIVETGFEEPQSRLSSELAQREEALKQEATFLTNEQNLIYSLLGVKKNIQEKKIVAKNLQEIEKDYSSFMQNFSGILFQLDKDFLPVLIEGSIEEMTGYSKEDFCSGNVKWADIIIHEPLPIVYKKVRRINSNPKDSLEKEYRIRRKDGEIRWVRETFKHISGNKGKFQGSIHDITPRKKIEETLRKREGARIKEIHHRIKNNLQVISSLLDLQAEKFNDKNVIEAFKESQNRVISMALIHEELYKSKTLATLDFASYLQKLTTYLLNSYTLKNQIKMKLNLEQAYLGMDTAIPLGIIVNELVSNSFKYAFKPGLKREISISLYRNKNSDGVHENSADSGENRKMSGKHFQYTLVVADNGPGIPEEIDIENVNSLGFQLISVLVDQIEGHLELKREAGAEFRISFNNM